MGTCTCPAGVQIRKRNISWTQASLLYMYVHQPAVTYVSKAAAHEGVIGLDIGPQLATNRLLICWHR